MLSFYDWYADLPMASPQVFGDQTDVPESGDWFNAGYLVMWGSNIPVTRTPDAHFMTEARYHGQKVVAVSPDYADNTKFADEWLRIAPGTDGALAAAMGHVILSEFHVGQRTPFFLDYLRRFTDSPFLVRLKARDGAYVPGKFLVAADVAADGVVDPASPLVRDAEVAATANAAFRPLVWDREGGIADPGGTLADHYGPEGAGRWNLDLSGVDPVLSAQDLPGAEPVALLLPRFDLPGGPGEGSVGAGVVRRGVPAVRVADGEYVTTVYDLLLAQYAVRRDGLPGEWPTGYDDASTPGTPAWQAEPDGCPGGRRRAHRPRVRAERDRHGRPLDDRDGRRHQPLLPLRRDLPDVPGADDDVRHAGRQRRRLGALRRAGEGPADHRVRAVRVRPGLAAAGPADDLRRLLLPADRPVAVRRDAGGPHRLTAGGGLAGRADDGGHPGRVDEARLDAVVPDVLPVPAAAGPGGPPGGRRPEGLGGVPGSSRATCGSRARTRTTRRTSRGCSRRGAPTCWARRPRAPSSSTGT